MFKVNEEDWFKFMNNIEYIMYEGELRKVSDVESDHIHLDDGTVIRSTEIVKNRDGIFMSTYSEKEQIQKIINLQKLVLNGIENFLDKFYKRMNNGKRKK